MSKKTKNLIELVGQSLIGYFGVFILRGPIWASFGVGFLCAITILYTRENSGR